MKLGQNLANPELFISTKFDNDCAKIVDFLLIKNFKFGVRFYGSHLILSRNYKNRNGTCF